MSRAPNRHRGPVSTRITAEPAAGSATSRSIATRSATSGTASSPATPTTSTGTPRALSASAIGAASALRRTSTAAVGVAAPSSHRAVVGSGPDGLPPSHVRSRHRTAVRTGWCRARRQAGAAARAPSTERRRALRRHRVGQMQGARRVAPAGPQFQGRGRRAVGERKVGGEPGQVRRRRAPPAVDRLDRITHRGERQAFVDAGAEQRRQRHPLRMPGVLVFVEQHHPETLAQLLTDLRELRRRAAPPRTSAYRNPSLCRRASAGAAHRSTAPVRCVRSGWPAF